MKSSKSLKVPKSFRLFDFNAYDEKDDNDKLCFFIQMFGINEKGETCSIIINDYKPFFYVKVADHWTQQQVTSLRQEIKKETNYDCIKSVEIVQHRKLYGFSGNKEFKFLKFTFNSMVSMNKVKYVWLHKPFKKFYFQNIELELYESNIPPLLRYFHIEQVSPSGWVQINTSKATKNKTKSNTMFSYMCSLKALKPLPEKETLVPYKICSFDIEASSSHGDFPMPVKSYKRLASNIADAFAIQKPDNNKKGQMLMSYAIYTAFGYKKIENIDLVYPIHPPTKEELKTMIDKILKKKMDASLYSEPSTNVLKITEMFAKKTHDDDDEETSHSTKKESLNQETCVHLMMSSLSRENKIKYLDLLLTSVLPKLEGDKVTFIGSTFLNYGEKEPYYNHCLVLNTCDDVPNTTIETCETEEELLLKWRDLIIGEDPDIIIGYNIFGFDYEFMFRRAIENRCVSEFLKLSRNNDVMCGKIVETNVEIENTKIVLATGEYDLRYYKIPGRIQIDMYTYFRRDFNLSSYKLDDVAAEYISDDIYKHESFVDEDGESYTKLYCKNIAGLHVNDYIHIELCGFTTDYYNNGEKFPILNIEREDNTNVLTIRGLHSFQKKTKYTMAKDDVTPQDIFRLTNGTSTDRARVAKYCIQDCNLVHHLMNKIDVITGYVEMASICSVPISYLVFRGQGIKLTSYVAKKCREKNTLMPDLDKSGENEGYEGAIVLPPKCSMYMDNPVACVDYSSLYPSSMISQNYSHDSKVWTKEYDLENNLINETGVKDEAGVYIYDNLPDYEYIDVEFDTYKYVRKKETAKAEKVKSGKMVCRWAQLPNNEKSIMPSILQELLKARSATKKLIKKESDPFMQNILDKRQLGYKVTANSLYGQCGAKTSTFYEKDVAASTTATGRSMIIYAKKIIEEVYGHKECETKNNGVVLTKAEYVYGDSVASYTPIYIRVNGNIHITEISNLMKYSNNKWENFIENGKEDKEYCSLENVETWSDIGWTPLKRVIRHKLAKHKKMYRILTHTGLIDVTDDHSLLNINGHEISPKDVTIGTELLHKTMTNEIFSNNNDDITIMKAKIYGFFFGDGSCGTYNCSSGRKSSWALNNANEYLLNKYFDLCKLCYPNYEWKIYDTLKSSGIYKLSFTCKTYGEKRQFIDEYCKDMYSDKKKIIPNFILNGTHDIRESFWEGVYDADGDKDVRGFVRIDQKNQISASHLCWLANSIGYKTSLNTRKDKPNIYRITATKRSQRKNPNAIKKKEEILYDDYVYDLTTENHHFAAGIGNMIVHNTDSVFFTFNLEDPKTKTPIRGEKALEITIEIAQQAADLCTQWLKPPMNLEYEKTLMPFILLSKKRYVGMLYEDDPNKGKLKYMGLSLKRRDSCDYLKDTYGEIINILMKENDIEKAIEFLNNSLMELINGKVSMDKLALTKALRSDYKNPQTIAHKVLSDRIGVRDPGNKPKPGDRIKFVFIHNKDPKSLLGDRVETPEYIIDNKLPIDYTYYVTNQLMKPILQLFGLALVPIYEKRKKFSQIKEYLKEDDKLQKLHNDDFETYMKKREKYCSAKIKTILFDDTLKTIENRKNGNSNIRSFFS